MREVENSHEVEETAYYQTKTIISVDIYNELKRKIVSKGAKIMLGSAVLIPMLLVVMGTITSGVFIISNIFLFVMSVPFIFTYESIYRKEKMKLIEGLQTGTGTAFTHTALFYDYGLSKINDDNIDGAVHLDYYAIDRFLETKSTYALYADSQVIIVNKMALLEERKSDWFIRFLREKCENVEWHKVKHKSEIVTVWKSGF